MIPQLERTLRETIRFERPFFVEGAGEQPTGEYTVETVETLIQELSFVAYRRVSTSILLPLHGRGSGSYQLLPIDPAIVATARVASC